jgi:nitrate reductase NapE component
MRGLRTLLSIAWLALALTVLISSISDFSLQSWQPTWLVAGVGGTLLALASAVFLFFQITSLRAVAIVGSVVFLLYWMYLFLISPPDAVNRYLMTGSAVILLAVSTIALIVVASRMARSR